MKSRFRLILALFAAFALAFALVACNGDDPGNDNGNDVGNDNGNDAVVVDPEDRTELVIGFGGPLTQGSVAFGQGALRATQLAVAQANESAEAEELGIYFTIEQADDMSIADTGVQAANLLVANRDLVGVVGHFNSAVSLPASVVYHEHGVVMISYGSTNPEVTARGLENTFRTCATDALQGPFGAEAAKAHGFETVVIIDDSSIYGQGLTAAFTERWVELGGEILDTDSTQQGQNDFTPVVTAINALNPDFVYFGGTSDADTGAGSLFARQLADGGFEGPMFGGDGIQNQVFIDEAGAEQADGTIATKPGAPIEDFDMGEQFIAEYTAMHPGYNPDGFDAFAFDAANAIIKATFEVAREMGAENVASTEGRRAVIEAVAGINFMGITGQISFDENGDNENPVITAFLVSDGTWIACPTVHYYR